MSVFFFERFKSFVTFALLLFAVPTSAGGRGPDAHNVTPRTFLTVYFTAVTVAKCDSNSAFRDTSAGPTRRPTVSC